MAVLRVLPARQTNRRLRRERGRRCGVRRHGRVAVLLARHARQRLCGREVTPFRDFLSYYNQFTDQIVAPAAKQKSLQASAREIGAAVSELRPDSAVVLVLVDQSTTSKDNPDPAMTSSSVLVSLARINGQWLITKFDPV
ncbi:twin-arginine translocation pathway signal [Mycobacterium intracellulare subsp. yongonense 05-1390]|uniref:Twin-arginine translocation pathway signal n=1 Tax=Mycobacterium parascrofulaceum ATCC BAA-614 TaxID=525368 RepID=D5PEF1_9MYCO|nr:twin-arginine translocation pathway signal [Mycobacterium intracellulare subsp. yongonense 05-1390]ARR76483.1 hypothetical protein MOTT12_00819 [Mycobacterium intracellulare subsp. yongonense]EFG75528.1 hypothetical protein HMPREF0591_4628 [Mycobacterium parascrofulaceum ATCC BAA-614]